MEPYIDADDHDYARPFGEVAVDRSFDLRVPTKTMCAIQRVYVLRAEFHLIATKNQIFYYVPSTGQFENLPLPEFQGTFSAVRLSMCRYFFFVATQEGNQNAVCACSCGNQGLELITTTKYSFTSVCCRLPAQFKTPSHFAEFQGFSLLYTAR